MFQFVVLVCVVLSLMIACDPTGCQCRHFFPFAGHYCTMRHHDRGLERPPPGVTPYATSSVHGTKEVCMVQFSFRPPGADYLGFEATPAGII